MARPLAGVAPLDVPSLRPRRVGTIDGDAFRAWARATYPRDTAKGIARDAGVSPATVDKWLGPPWSLPGTLPICRLICAYGLDFIRAVFVPPPEWADADVQLAALDHIARQADAIATQARLARGVAA